jgi:hypothetical protein
MIWIKKQTINPEVTDYYLGIVGEAYKKLNQEVRFFYNWSEYTPQKEDVTVVTRYKEVLKMIREKRKYVYWIQGILPEENYAQFHSKFRVLVYEMIERILITNTVNQPNYFLMVSDRMKRHYEEKYKMKIKNCYIMPCNNEVVHQQSFYELNKYANEVFCYAGGLNVWQCIDETLMIYKRIEETCKNTKLILLIKDREKAEELLKKYEIKNYEIDFVPVDKLPEKLKKAKYGFIIRDDLELNRVATPTKLMTYMGNGIIPVLSDCLEGLLERVEESEYIIKMKDTNNLEPIYRMMDKQIYPDDILKDYKKVYHNHYDQEKHINDMAKVLPR